MICLHLLSIDHTFSNINECLCGMFSCKFIRYLLPLFKRVNKIVIKPLGGEDGELSGFQRAAQDGTRLLIQIATILSKFGKFFNEAAQLCLLQLTEKDDVLYNHCMVINQDKTSNTRNNKKQDVLKSQKESEKKDLSLEMIKDLKPKHPVSSFFFFYKERSQQIAKEQGEILGCQLAKIIGNIWQTMSEAEKQPFEVKAKQSRENYEKEMLEYTSKYSKEIAMYKRHKKELKQEKKRFLEAYMKPSDVKTKQQVQVKEQEKEDNHSSQLSDSMLSLSQDMSDSLGIQSKESQSTIRRITPKHGVSQPNKAVNSIHTTEIISNSNAKQSNTLDEEIILTIGDDSHTNFQEKSILQGKISKPKGPVSSFFIFYQLQGNRIASENGISLGPQAMKLASVMWSQIPQSQKEKYKVQSERTRKKYRKEMTELKQQYGDSVFDTKKIKKSRKESNKTKKEIS